MPFVKGQVANPNGRPPGTRAMSTALQEAANVKTRYRGKWITKREAIARIVLDALTTGQATFVDGKTLLKLGSKDYLDLFKFFSLHTDGPVRQDIDITSGGQPIKTLIGFTPAEWIEAEIIEEDEPKRLLPG